MIDRDERVLVSKASRGDEDAFEALVARYEKGLYNLAFRMVPDREDAMDIVQEVFLKVHQALPGFRGDSRFSTWVYRVCVNASLDFLRKKQKIQTYSLDEPLNFGESQVAKEVPGDGMSVEDLVENMSLGHRILSLIQELDPVYKTIIVLCDIQGHTYQEIADILDISVGTVKSRLHRARNMVRRLMSEEQFEEQFQPSYVKNDERGDLR